MVTFVVSILISHQAHLFAGNADNLDPLISIKTPQLDNVR